MNWKGLPSWVLEDAGVESDTDGLVRIPYRLPDGQLYAHRMVAPNGRRWWSPGGRTLIPYGLELQEQPRFRRYAALVVAEGESDTLVARTQAAPCRIDVLGIPGAGTWQPAWAVFCRGYGAGVFVAGDGDAPGRKLNEAVRASIPDAIALAIPDGEDLRSTLTAPDALVNLIDEAEAEEAREERLRKAWLESSSLEDLQRRLAA